MFCWNCGTQISDEASFCPKCGKPQKQSVRVQEPKWETCEIAAEKIGNEGIFSGARFRFWAKAIGPNGLFSAGESEMFTGYYATHSYPDSESRENQEALKGLVDWLVKEGWEPTGDRGSEWFNLRFRRHHLQEEPVADWETCEIVYEKRADVLRGDMYWFLAKAKGPKGDYIAGQTIELTTGTRSFSGPSSNDKLAARAHGTIVEQLLKDGWEPIDNQPPSWWNSIFRRRIQKGASTDPHSEETPNQQEAIWSAIKAQYRHAAESWLKIPQIAEIEKHLAEDELPEGVLFGKHPDAGVGGGGLWATNKRLLYTGTTFWKKPIVIEYPYDQISSVTLNNGQLMLKHSGKQTVFKEIDKLARASDFIELVKRKITTGK